MCTRFDVSLASPPVAGMESRQAEGMLRSTVLNSSSTIVSEDPYPSLSPEVRASLATAFGRIPVESVVMVQFDVVSNLTTLS